MLRGTVPRRGKLPKIKVFSEIAARASVEIEMIVHKKTARHEADYR